MELIDKKDVPRWGSSIYPWEEWKSKLTNGQVGKLSREEDVPKDSRLYRYWGKTNAINGLTRTARRHGLIIFERRGEIYIELAERAEA